MSIRPTVGFLIALLLASPVLGQEDLWSLANSKRSVHRFSTLFDARDVQRMADEARLNSAVDWCKKTGVTKVYVESFRDGYQAERSVLERVRDRLRKEGIEASGCITPTAVGKLSNGWKSICCYTDQPTQEKLQKIFEFEAALFDEIMIDDFWFTDCTCPACDAARKAKIATVGDKKYPVSGDTWEDYRCELMVRISQDRILAASKKVNPKVKIIVKYPQWYDRFHERGYEVLRETADFDRTWVGTETRNYADRQWGGTAQYEGYFIMRWLGGIGGAKCGGGWYDPFGTTEPTYIEQARQTILAAARESMLFCYGALQRGTGPKDIEALRANMPELFNIAEQVGRRKIIGVAAYKPANSHPANEQYVFDFVGMLGLPLVPCHEFPAGAPSAFFSIHAIKDPALGEKLTRFIDAGKPILLTDSLAQRLTGKLKLDAPNVRILKVGGNAKNLLKLSQADCDAIRAHMLKPLNVTFKAPNKVALYLYSDGSHVIENFNDEPAAVQLGETSQTIPARGWSYQWR